LLLQNKKRVVKSIAKPFTKMIYQKQKNKKKNKRKASNELKEKKEKTPSSSYSRHQE